MVMRWILAFCSVALFGADWTTFRDPMEQAFTIDVPQGWIARGGAFRMGYSDVRPMVDVVSPDGKINVRVGDVAIPIYYVPDRLHPAEGSLYDLGAQAQMTIARYRKGDEYAAAYARMRFRDSCPGPAVRPPDTGGPIPEIPGDTPPNSSTGEVSYRCNGNRVTTVHASTALFQGFWAIHTIVSYEAPPDQAALARSVAIRMVGSLRITPQWKEHQDQMEREAMAYQQARQAQRRREISAQVAEFEMKMQAMRDQVHSFQQRQSQQAHQVEQFTNALNGITPTIDPLGNPRDVWTGTKSRYWQNGMGQVINSDVSPGAGWREMQVRH
jgi:hypothetical protein